MGILVMYANNHDLMVGLKYGDHIQETILKHKDIPVENVQEQLISWIHAFISLENKPKLITINGTVFSEQSLPIIRLTQQYALKDNNNIATTIASNLEILWEIPVFIIDPPSLREYNSAAFVTGSPNLTRSCRGDIFIFKYLVRQAALKNDLILRNTNFIVANLDQEIQIAALSGDKILDVSSSSDDGPFSYSQSGGLPFDQVLDLCAKSSNQEDLLHLISQKGGLSGYLGDLEFKDLWLTNNETVSIVREAFVYQIAKEIGAFAAIFQGKVEAIFLTGELSKNIAFINNLVKRIGFLGDVIVYSGNYALKSLFEGASQILTKKGAEYYGI